MSLTTQTVKIYDTNRTTNRWVDNVVPLPSLYPRPTEYYRQLSIELESDAKEVAETLTNGDWMTVCCAVLTHPYKPTTGMRFLFTSLHEYERKAYYSRQGEILLEEAHERGYHAVLTQNSHAEMSMLQFLEGNRNYWKYPVAFGLSRDMCFMCGELLDCMWRGWADYHPDKGRDQTMKYDRWYTPAALCDIITANE